MPRIRIYPQDVNLTGEEQLFGSDKDNRTVNIPLSALAGFISAGDLDLGVVITSPADNQITIQFTESGIPLGDPQTVDLSIREVNHVLSGTDGDGNVTIQFQYEDEDGNFENIGDLITIMNGEDGAPAGFGTPIATALPEGTPPSVVAVGPDTEKVFQFGIPAGAKGEQGSYYVKAFTRSATNPGTPTDLTWTESTNAFTGTDAGTWQGTVPAGTEQTWEVQVLFDPSSSATTITSWGVPFHAGGTGPQGEDGPPGPAAGFGTPTATQLAVGAAPTVTATGPNTAKIFTFGIPMGARGTQGVPGGKGDTGAKGDPGEGIKVDTSSLDSLGNTTVLLETADTEVPAGSFLVQRGLQGLAGTNGTPGDTVTVTEAGGQITITSSGGTSETLNEVEAGGDVFQNTPELNSITIGGVVYAITEHATGGGVTDDTFYGVVSALPTAGIDNVAPLDVVAFQNTMGTSNDEVLFFPYDLGPTSSQDRFAVINLPDSLIGGLTVNFLFGHRTAGPFTYQVENVFSSSAGSTTGYTTFSFGYGADVYVQIDLT